ncbi:MAG TPA: 4Fe-4S dicluster domain-containing protein [Anaerolineales bacterium]|nr:4Fe-4S dicluster domain-containing protein [Anaerolineales bacterium]
MIGMLIDVTRCTGCNQCVNACSTSNKQGELLIQPQQIGDGLSAFRWTTVVQSPEGRFVRKFCRHCLEPACVSVCPVGAMQKTSQGPVIYDPQLCMGCRYCMMACPFGIPRYEWDSAAPWVQKCNFCFERLAEGKQPACVEACPYDALQFGEREELIQIAKTRMAENPGKYQPVIYGEHEAGGTSVLYLSDVSLDWLGYQGNPGNTALPTYSWNWLEKVPGVGLTTAGLMTGLFFFLGRRMKFEEAKVAQEKQQTSDNQSSQTSQPSKEA